MSTARQLFAFRGSNKPSACIIQAKYIEPEENFILPIDLVSIVAPEGLSMPIIGVKQ